MVIHIAVGSRNPCKIKAVETAFRQVFAASSSGVDNVEILISSFDVPSGVNHQPIGDTETLQGAKNRAQAAFDAAFQKHKDFITSNSTNQKQPTQVEDNDEQSRILEKYPPDFGVGLEGGVEIRIDPETNTKTLWCMAWMAITSSCAHKTCQHPQSTFVTSSTAAGAEHNRLWGSAKTASFLLPDQIARMVLEENMELGDADDKVFQRVNSKQRDGTVGILSNSLITRSEYYVHALTLALVPYIWPELYNDEYRN